jgi:hypothetical protein
MSERNDPTAEGTYTRQDIDGMLAYTGPSFRRAEPISPGIMLLDYRNTDDNERKISILLSARSIPFHIERRGGGWTRPAISVIVTVPAELHLEANAILRAAADASVLEIVEKD